MNLIAGDCLEVMAGMEPESVDAICTDPPYDLTYGGTSWRAKSGEDFGRHAEMRGGFMGKRWDGTGIAFRRETWEAAYRVAKPSAYLLAFGGTRTVHRMTVALEDAGWIIRDMLMWVYLSGFPKSRANLKPAYEPIVLARKPGPLRMLDIEGCRIPGEDHDSGREGEPSASTRYTDEGGTNLAALPGPRGGDPSGRWPSNVLMVDPALGDSSRVFLIPKADRGDREPVLGGHDWRQSDVGNLVQCRRCFRIRDDATERLPCSEQVPYTHNHVGRDMTNPSNAMGGAERLRVERGKPAIRPRQNVHPTVKPVDLMRHLVRLVTPTGGVVLDPFLGSGTTALAAEMEGFQWIGIEREAEYVAIAEARLNGTQRGLGLPA